MGQCGVREESQREVLKERPKLQEELISKRGKGSIVTKLQESQGLASSSTHLLFICWCFSHCSIALKRHHNHGNSY